MSSPLPTPCIENVAALSVHIRDGTYDISPNSVMRQDMLAWTTFLAKEAPVLARRLIPLMYHGVEQGQWNADVVEAVAAAGCIQLLCERLRVFHKSADVSLRRTKIWQWVTMPAFAKPRIARSLLYMSTQVLMLNKYENPGQVRKLLQSHVIVTTIANTAEWLANKMPDSTVMGIARKKRSYPEVAAAIRSTVRYHTLTRIAKFRATVYLTLFFRRHVSAEKTRTAMRGDCPICWAPKILQPLHGDVRHGVCHRCTRRLHRKQMLDQCPMCRTAL